MNIKQWGDAINQYYWEVLNNYVIKLGSRTITKDDIAKREHWSELMLNNWLSGSYLIGGKKEMGLSKEIIDTVKKYGEVSYYTFVECENGSIKSIEPVGISLV